MNLDQIKALDLLLLKTCEALRQPPVKLAKLSVDCYFAILSENYKLVKQQLVDESRDLK